MNKDIQFSRPVVMFSKLKKLASWRHSQRLLVCGGVMALVACGSLVKSSAPGTGKSELAPTGKIRVGLAVAPALSTLFVEKNEKGELRGPTADIGAALGEALGVPVEFVFKARTDELVNAAVEGLVDVTFLPVNAARKAKVDFGPTYSYSRSTYLVPPGSDIKTIGDVDRPKIRVVAVAGTATIANATKALKVASVTGVKSVDEAMQMLRAGKAEAFALGRDPLDLLAPKFPGSRVLGEDFEKIPIAIAVPKDRPMALAYVTEFINGAKASGLIRRAFDKAGLQHIAVAE